MDVGDASGGAGLLVLLQTGVSAEPNVLVLVIIVLRGGYNNAVSMAFLRLVLLCRGVANGSCAWVSLAVVE